jgi:charged multivesicular body protein 1
MGQKETKPVPQQSASDKMFDILFEFKSQAKMMKKEASKAEAQEKQYVLKVKDAIEKNNLETAKILASDAIRKKTEAKRLLILSSKLEAVQARLQSAMTTQRVFFLYLS